MTVAKEGYESRTFHLESRVNDWYIFGNILIGGLIGWVIVDPITRAMWKLEPEKIEAPLVETVCTVSGEMGLYIPLLEDVPAPLRAGMIPLQ